jgi:hypothetical protein
MENPFSPKHPVNPRYFVDRESILEEFERILSISAASEIAKPDNIAILGRWGVGKTSLLTKFEEIALNNKIKVFTARIELAPSACTFIEDFVSKALDDIERTCKANLSVYDKIKLEISKWKIGSIEKIIILKKKEIQKHIISLFQDSLRDLWFKILKPRGIQAALLNFDDIHYLAQHNKEGLYDLRSVFQSLAMDGCNYMLIITGPLDLFGKVREIAEPFSRFFSKFKLDVFDYGQTKNAILKPIKLNKLNIQFEEEVIKEISSLTEGHPYFIHFIMRDLVSLVNGKINLNAFKVYWKRVSFHLQEEKFIDDLNLTSETEKKILIKAANLNKKDFLASEITISGIWTLLKRLEEKELITKIDKGRYKIYHPLFKEYLRSKQ